MAQLNDTMVQGDLRVTGTIYGNATTATSADITKTADTTNGDKLQIGSGASVNVTNSKHAASADLATAASSVNSNGAGTADAARHVWFSDSSTETKRVYNDNFKYNPVGNIISSNISGNAATATSATSATNATNVPTQGDASSSSNARHIWFSSNGSETKRAHSDSFMYTPSTNTISANISGTSGSVGSLLYAFMPGSYSYGYTHLFTVDYGTVKKGMCTFRVNASRGINLVVTINASISRTDGGSTKAWMAVEGETEATTGYFKLAYRATDDSTTDRPKYAVWLIDTGSSASAERRVGVEVVKTSIAAITPGNNSTTTLPEGLADFTYANIREVVTSSRNVYTPVASSGTQYYLTGVNSSSAGWLIPNLMSHVKVYQDTNNGWILYVGNASGTSGTPDKGRLYLSTGKGANVRLEPNGSLASNVDITLPTYSGTVALLSDFNASVRYKRWKQSGSGWAKVATLTYTFTTSANRVSVFELGYFATSTLVRYGTLTLAVHGASSTGGALEATLRIDSLYSDIGNSTNLDACVETVGNTGDECTVNLWLYLTGDTYAYAWLRHMTSMQGSGGIVPNQWVYTSQDTGGSAKPTASGSTRVFNATKSWVATSGGTYANMTVGHATYADSLPSSAVGNYQTPVYIKSDGKPETCTSLNLNTTGAAGSINTGGVRVGNENVPVFFENTGKPVVCTGLSLSTTGSAARLANTSKVGDTNKPVYFTANGVPAVCTSLSLNVTGNLTGNADTANALVVQAQVGSDARPVYFPSSGTPTMCGNRFVYSCDSSGSATTTQYRLCVGSVCSANNSISIV